MRYKSFKKTKSVKIISALLVVLLIFSGLQTQRSDVYAETICNNPATLEDDIKSVFQENFESMNTDPFSYTVTGEEVLKYFLKTDESGNLVEPAEMDPEKTYYIDWFFEQLFDMQDINYNAYTRLSYENISLSASSEPYYQVEDMLLTYTYTISWMDDGVGLLTPSQGREAVRAHAQEFLNSPEYPETGTDDDKLRAINEYICSTFQYDYRLFVEGEEDDVIYTAFQMINDVGQGAIGDYPRGVCQAYTMYGYVMLKEAGYEALTISGTAGDPAGPHTWNMVKVGNNWYHIDFTWNDPIRTDNPEPYVKRQSGEGSVSENYLLRSDSEISINHFWDATNEYGYSYPEALSTWASREYTVTFNSQGGSEVINVNTGSNTTITLPDTPTRTGYTFGGWYKESECINIWDFESDTVTSDITLYAKWTINQYTITFDTDGGTTIDPITQDYATVITAPADPIKVGYTFAGWDTPVPGTMPAEDMTITALWTVDSAPIPIIEFVWGSSITYTNGGIYDENNNLIFTLISETGSITYSDLNNLINLINPIVPEYITIRFEPNIRVILPNYVTFINYGTVQIANKLASYSTLYNYNTMQLGDSDINGYFLIAGPVQSFGSININGNMSFSSGGTLNFISEPWWGKNGYKVTSVEFDTQSDSLSNFVFYYYYNANIPQPDELYKVGYTFDGWYQESACVNPWDFSTYTINYYTTLYAKWRINTYTVTFRDWDGNVLKIGEVDYGTSAVVPADPMRTGYTFTGWDVAFNNITSDLEVVAQYAVDQYTITFDTDGGTTIDSITQDYASVVIAPAGPTKVGYTFASWDTPVPETMPAENITITALWTINTYTVTFKDWDGSILKTETVDYGSGATAPADPSRDYYTFTGWDAAFSNITADLEVTAQYLIDSYTVSFNSQGGSSVNNKSADYDTTITAPTTPTRTGYTFGGWFKEASCINAWIFASDRIIAETTLYAKWTINTYTVTFNSQGGSSINNKSADFNTTITAPTAPTRSGYTFLGWYKEAPGTNEWIFATDKVTSNITLYAKWQSNAPENITSGSYTVNNTRLYVSKIKYETTIFAFMSKINDSNFVKAYKGTEEITGTAFICTGMLIKIMDGATVKKTYTAVVTGDINGDGKVTLTDFVQLKSHILNKSTLTGAYASAADLNGDGKITLTDFVKAKAHLLNKELITPQAY